MAGVHGKEGCSDDSHNSKREWEKRSTSPNPPWELAVNYSQLATRPHLLTVFISY